MVDKELVPFITKGSIPEQEEETWGELVKPGSPE